MMPHLTPLRRRQARQTLLDRAEAILRTTRQQMERDPYSTIRELARLIHGIVELDMMADAPASAAVIDVTAEDQIPTPTPEEMAAHKCPL